MVVNLEAATFLPGVASVHIEHSFVIGVRGAERLLPGAMERLLVMPVAHRASSAERSNKRKAS
jgi:hypothetical protein